MFKVSDESAFAKVSLVPPIPAISLKLDHQDLKTRNKIKKILGMEIPSVESVIKHRNLTLCWVSNDELLLLSEGKEVGVLLEKIRKELGNIHSLVEDVTDLRAWFLLEGEGAIDLLRKGVPKDFSKLDLSSKSFFRSRLGEIQVNILMDSNQRIIISVLRSVEEYTCLWLNQCSRGGSEINFDL